MKNQTFTVDRGQLDDHENIFFFRTETYISRKTSFKGISSYARNRLRTLALFTASVEFHSIGNGAAEREHYEVTVSVIGARAPKLV